MFPYNFGTSPTVVIVVEVEQVQLFTTVDNHRQSITTTTWKTGYINMQVGLTKIKKRYKKYLKMAMNEKNFIYTQVTQIRIFKLFFLIVRLKMDTCQ